MVYLFYDCETGGMDEKQHSLLTAYFGIYDQNIMLIDDLYLQLKPENQSLINVTPEALKVTNMDLNEHLSDPSTITYSEGYRKLLSFLEKNKIKGKKRSYRPCGHNITYDNKFIWAQLMPESIWDKYIHYNPLDTLRILTFLQDIGILPVNLGSLTSLVDYFNIKMGEAHNAREDIKMNVEVYKCLKNILQTKKTEFAGNVSNSLLKIIER